MNAPTPADLAARARTYTITSNQSLGRLVRDMADALDAQAAELACMDRERQSATDRAATLRNGPTEANDHETREKAARLEQQLSEERAYVELLKEELLTAQEWKDVGLQAQLAAERSFSASRVEAADRWRAMAEAADATIERVQCVHQVRVVQVLAEHDCAAEECAHEDSCPTVDMQVCAACWDIADTVSYYWSEVGNANSETWEAVAWPCATRKALAAAPAVPPALTVPRRITTGAELDALPDGAIVTDEAGRPYRAQTTPESGRGYRDLTRAGCCTHIPLPAAVVWLPAEGGGPS